MRLPMRMRQDVNQWGHELNSTVAGVNPASDFRVLLKFWSKRGAESSLAGVREVIPGEIPGE
jgi:hypothetical protein